MPAVIIPIAQMISGAIVAIGGGTFGSLAVGATVATAFAAGSYGLMLNAVMKALGPKKPKGSGRGLDQQLYDAAMPGRILFGQVRVGGAHLIPPIVSGSGQRSHRLVALAIHEIDSFITTYGDQTEITNAQIAAVTGAANDGRVESGKWAPNGTSTTYLWIRRYVGSSTQTTDYILSQVDGTAFSANFRGRGIAYAAITYGWSGSGSGYLWQTGLPDFTFTVKGMKCYDPRLDSTNGGTGTQRYATPSTWAWSANPAVVAGTFLMFDELLGGGGYDPATEIDWPTVAAAANLCDANVNIPSGTQDRYTCNLVLDATALFEDNLSDIIDCMLGRCVWRDGKWRLYAGAWDTATFTIDESDWISPLTIQTVAPRREGRWNGVKCFYVDPARNYQRVECYPRTSATYLSDDANDRIWLELERAGCNTETEAQRHAEMILRQSRNQIKLTGRLGPKFQYLALWETGIINFASLGWSSKTFRLITYKLNPDGSVDVGFSEEQSTDWTDMASGEYSSPSLATLPDSNVQQPDAPTALTIGEMITGTIQLAITPGEVKPLGTAYQFYASPGTLWNASSAQLLWEGDASNAFVPSTPGYLRWYHVRAHHGSYYSGFYPNTFGTPFMLTPRADNTNNNRIVPDMDMTVGTPAFWSLVGSNNQANVNYVGSATGASAGVIRFIKTNSEQWRNDIYGRPHPNAISSLGYPNAGTRMYWMNMKFRVNSYVAISSYGGLDAGSGGFFAMGMIRATSGDVSQLNVKQASMRQLGTGLGIGEGTIIRAPFWPNLTKGAWYETEDVLVLPALPTPNQCFDYGLIRMYDAWMNSGTMIEIDRFTATDMGFVNAPLVRGMEVNTCYGGANLYLGPSELAAEMVFLTGSLSAKIPSASSRDYWWQWGYKTFVSKPNSVPANCYIITESTSDFLCLVGTTSRVHTIVLNSDRAIKASVIRADSFNWIVEGQGVT